MNDNGKRYWVRRDAEEQARHVMGAIVVILFSFAICVALASPFILRYVCHLRGC